MQFKEPGHPQDMPHIANTYSALSLLKILGHDFSRVNGDEILRTLHLY